MDRSERMRMHLASVGILLDEPQDPAVGERDAKPANVPRDEAAIRGILEPLGCPEWAIASCPSVEHAHTYRAPKLRRRGYPPR